MFKKLALIFLWFLITPAVLVGSAIFITSYEHGKLSKSTFPSATKLQTQNNFEGQVLGVEITDMRSYLVANFLKGTRLESYSDLIVQASDKYGLDYRLIPAIAMRESGGGNKTKEETHNAWGFENGRTNFSSWEEAIETVAKTLKVKYADKGLTTPEEIMPVYAPPQIEKDGKWARDINFFFSKMEKL